MIKKIGTGIIVFFSFLAIGVGIGNIALSVFSSKDKSSEEIEVKEYVVKDTLQFQDSLLNYIIQLRIEHPYTVYSQAIQETHHFTSSLFQYNHNLFGMKFPERRATTAIGVRNGHAVYKDWKMSVIDYALFQMGYMKGLEREEYISKLYNYAEDTLYINKIRSIQKNFKN